MTGDDVLSVIAHTCPNGHEVPVLQPLPCPFCSAGVAYEPCSVGMALADQLRGAVCLTDAERERLLWWLHRPVPPGPMKDLDVALIAKLTTGRGQ